MLAEKNFQERLQALHASEKFETIAQLGGYRNGQVPLLSDDVSTWDNYDRYFKFYSVYTD